MNLLKSTPLAEYQQIRKYMVDMILLAGDKPQRVASMRELARHFNVSSTTIQKAMKDLIRDGLLISRPGIGLFTNPNYAWTDRRPPLIGLLPADGRQLYYNSYLWNVTAAIGDEIVNSDRLLHLINLFFPIKAVMEGFELYPLTGLIWVSPGSSSANTDEFIAGIDVPIVQIGGDPHPDRSSVQIDYEQEGYDVGRQLLAEGRTEPVFIGNDLETNPQLAGLRRCFDENGVALNESLLVNSDAQLSNRLETILNIKKTPEAIYAANGSLMRISTVLKQYKLDWIDGCRLVADRYAQPIPGWMIWQDAREIARVAIELLDEKIKQPDSPVRTVMISRTLQPSGLTVRKLQRESFRDERYEQRFQ